MYIVIIVLFVLQERWKFNKRNPGIIKIKNFITDAVATVKNCQIIKLCLFFVILFYTIIISVLQNYIKKCMFYLLNRINSTHCRKTDYNPNLPGVLRYGAGVPGSLIPGVKISFFRTDACSRSSCS